MIDIKKFHTIVRFLKESNAIEGVWDSPSLRQAIKAWMYIKKYKRLTIDNILKTHEILSHLATDIDEDQKGQFRKVPVWIGGREGKPWYALPELMNQWVMNANDLISNQTKKDSVDTLERIIQEQHVLFETIHPFIDFNGRIGRILWQRQRIKCGLPIKIIYEKEKYLYYEWFEE